MLCPAPEFTRENANKMREKGYETIVQKKNREIDELKQKLSAAFTALEDDKARRESMLRKQVGKCDEAMDKAKDPKVFKQWAEAKARLWELLYPKPGSLRPKAGRSERAPVSPLQPIAEPIQPQPVVNQAPLVVSEIEQSHKSESIQS